MNSYRYRVTVEKLSDARGEPVHGQSLSFYTANHDDILAIVNQLQNEFPFDSGTAASLGVGLKLFSEVTLTRRSDPMFDNIRPALAEFIQQLKQSPIETASSLNELLK
ncbi:DUF3861 domain-containing protein [Edaphobacter albus]|uniref:DUF3861 domain-containing protein n=1 Tax=Edaphobacter sp. 4G125 TaxID=2763071 RepID=UPI00164573E2|nr:DUF3861 domain-containing protein [Edaphobacter sp. 4G125]QNI37894.1 DUF3861 domain-containing protein [Edaphobacter sp. 4G125]